MSGERDGHLSDLQRAVTRAQDRLSRVRVATADQDAIRAAEDLVLRALAELHDYQERRAPLA